MKDLQSISQIESEKEVFNMSQPSGYARMIEIDITEYNTLILALVKLDTLKRYMQKSGYVSMDDVKIILDIETMDKEQGENEA
jgi:hypothetical protein